MTDLQALLPAALGLAACVVLLGRVVSRSLTGQELWRVALSAAIVGAGLLLESVFVPSRPAVQVLLVGLVALAAVPPLMELRLRGTVREHVSASRIPLLVLGLSVLALAVNLVNNPFAPPAEVYARAMAPVFWMLVALVVLIGGLDRVSFATGALLAFCALCALLPLYPAPVLPCQPDKCSVFGALLAGPFKSENFLSVLAGSVIFLAWSTRRRDAFTVLAAGAGALALLGAGGRGSLLGLGIGVLLGVLLSVPGVALWVRAWGPARRRALALAATAAYAGAAMWLLTSAEPADFSRRGSVWLHGMAVVREHWVFGAGLSRWDGYEGMPPVWHHYPHSQYLLVLFAAGLVGLLVFVGLMAALLASAAAAPSPGLLGHVGFLLTVGLVEVVLNPLSVDGLSWLLLAHFLPLVHHPAQRPHTLPLPVDDFSRRW